MLIKRIIDEANQQYAIETEDSFSLETEFGDLAALTDEDGRAYISRYGGEGAISEGVFEVLSDGSLQRVGHEDVELIPPATLESYIEAACPEEQEGDEPSDNGDGIAGDE
jgi:hypothetical protein